jgi:ribosome-binding protein aMBF1 (putative translation factor)
MNDNDISFQDWFASKVEELKDDPVFVLEGVLYELTERIVEEMEKQGVSRSDLARKMGKKPSFITRVLRGNANLTFSTAVQIGLALGLKLQVNYLPQDSGLAIPLDHKLQKKMMKKTA